jgi:hypothetical protein
MLKKKGELVKKLNGDNENEKLCCSLLVNQPV